MSFNQNELTMLSLIDSFIAGEITAPDFEIKYLKAWRNYRDSPVLKTVNKTTQTFFDSVFLSVDCYCSDPELIDENDLDEQGLLHEVLSLKTSWNDTKLT